MLLAVFILHKVQINLVINIISNKRCLDFIVHIFYFYSKSYFSRMEIYVQVITIATLISDENAVFILIEYFILFFNNFREVIIHQNYIFKIKNVSILLLIFLKIYF